MRSADHFTPKGQREKLVRSATTSLQAFLTVLVLLVLQGASPIVMADEVRIGGIPLSSYIGDLKDLSPYTRARSLRMLLALDPKVLKPSAPRLGKLLIHILNDEDEALANRRMALHVLQRVGTIPIEALITVVRGRNDYISLSDAYLSDDAANELAARGSKAGNAIPALRELARKRPSTAAIRALVAVSGPREASLFIELLHEQATSREPNLLFCVTLSQALREWKVPEGVDAIAALAEQHHCCKDQYPYCLGHDYYCPQIRKALAELRRELAP